MVVLETVEVMDEIDVPVTVLPADFLLARDLAPKVQYLPGCVLT